MTFGKKAVCPRWKTTLTSCWQEPRKQPLFYALSGLLMLLLAQFFSFVNLNVAGIQYASMATLFIVLVQFIPAFCMLADGFTPYRRQPSAWRANFSDEKRSEIKNLVYGRNISRRSFGQLCKINDLQ